MSTAQIAALTARRAGTFVDLVLKTGWHDRWLYVVAVFALAIAQVVASVGTASPDIGLAAAFLIPMSPFVLVVVGGSPVLDLWLRERRTGDRSRSLIPYIAAYWTEKNRAVAFAHAMMIFTLFSAAFATFKSSVAVISPFAWDSALAHADRILHFGFYPHELLMPLFGSAPALFVINVAYHLWFMLVIISMLLASLTVREVQLRRQYIMSFMLIWFVGGFLVAMLFSSAGPCYFERLGLGDSYVPLMMHLRAAAEVLPLPALDVQEYLWKGFSGELAVSSGISAFPSMHVATATLMALGAFRINRTLGYCMWGFVGLIQVGSVMLGWHYAIDGYGGALVSIAIWKLAGFWAARSADERVQVPCLG